MWRRPLRVENIRRYSIKPRAKPSYRDLISGPVAKSLFLTIVFGSVLVDATKNRKEIEALRAAYETKFRILEDITTRVRNKEPVDVALELKVANAITRNKYNSVTDVELDDQLEEMLKMAEEEEEGDEVVQADMEPKRALAEEKKSATFL
ncbi:CIC11C00000001955 [Sungouiella intermedia]|uniref:CIC11C00000001955 n=1 Tax=Sungouiella intermedia TaxID=45354 RepID=A0A1L0D166_9ASCO|nr:CIC11C00000001955 [[Candida] intermedia]